MTTQSASNLQFRGEMRQAGIEVRNLVNGQETFFSSMGQGVMQLVSLIFCKRV